MTSEERLVGILDELFKVREFSSKVLAREINKWHVAEIAVKMQEKDKKIALLVEALEDISAKADMNRSLDGFKLFQNIAQQALKQVAIDGGG